MVARWSALSTCVRVSSVGPLSALRGEIREGSYSFVSSEVLQWDTGLCVLDWDISTVAWTISVSLVKLERLHDTLSEWPSDREHTSEKELSYLTGRRLHLCEVVRVGKCLIRHMLTTVSLRFVHAWGAKFHVAHTSAASSPRIRLGPEFHADVFILRLFVEGGLGSPACRFFATLYRSYTQPPAFFLRSDASGDAMGGCTQCVHGRSRMTIDPRIPTMAGRSTSDFHQPGRHCLQQARSAVRCSASRMKSELHPSKNRS